MELAEHIFNCRNSIDKSEKAQILKVVGSNPAQGGLSAAEIKYSRNSFPYFIQLIF